MARTSAWRRAVLAVVAAAGPFACSERIAAPGSCPALCPADSLSIVDTLITGVVSADTSVRGYTQLSVLPIMVAANLDSLQARPIVRFARLPKRWFPIANDTVGVRIGRVDSITLDLRLDSRDTLVKKLRLLLYRLPGDSLDSTVTYASAQPYFTPANLMDSLPVFDGTLAANLHLCWKPSPSLPADSACAHDLSAVRGWLPPLPDTSDADTLTPGLGLSVRADALTAAVLASSETGVPPHLKFYVHGDSTADRRDTFATVFDLVPGFDTYVFAPDPPPISAHAIVVGGQPSARAFMTFQIPSYYVDSVSVSRATLLVTTSRPVRGFPHGSFGLRAVPILRYFAGKSLISQDTTTWGQGAVSVGDSGVVAIEIGPVLRVWHGTNPDSLPRSLSILARDETFNSGQFEAFGSTGGPAAPRLQVSFVRPLKFGVP